MSWYYVDPSGNTLGPLSADTLKQNWSTTITEETYVWNGADVSQWTPLKDVPQLLKLLKPVKSMIPPQPIVPAQKAPAIKSITKKAGGSLVCVCILCICLSYIPFLIVFEKK